VCESDPVLRLEAHLDGFMTPSREDALETADIIVTETGATDVITAADLQFLKDGAILLNGGHFPTEIDVTGMLSSDQIAKKVSLDEEALVTLVLKDGRRITIATLGHMANLAGPRPLGNSIESMDFGFALQAKCLERIASKKLGTEHCLVPVPRDIDEWVASAYLDRNT
jgi:adenosylhomocysteinase